MKGSIRSELGVTISDIVDPTDHQPVSQVGRETAYTEGEFSGYKDFLKFNSPIGRRPISAWCVIGSEAFSAAGDSDSVVWSRRDPDNAIGMVFGVAKCVRACQM